MTRLALALLWMICGFVAWGQTLGSFTHKFPAQDHTSVAAMMAIGGPFGVVVSTICDHPYHWRIVPMTTEERWKAFQEEDGGTLGREYFERNYN